MQRTATEVVSDIDRINRERRRNRMEQMLAPDWQPFYSPWRHGGWYVDTICYPSGAVGCVSRNYPDRKWRAVCVPGDTAYASRNEAAQAERAYALGLWIKGDES